MSEQTEVLHTVAAAAKRLGIKPSTLRKWRFERRIEAIRVGRRAVRITETEIRRIVNAGREPATYVD